MLNPSLILQRVIAVMADCLPIALSGSPSLNSIVYISEYQVFLKYFKNLADKFFFRISPSVFYDRNDLK